MLVQRKSHAYALVALVAAVPIIVGATASDDGFSDDSTQLTVTGQGLDSQPAEVVQILAGVEQFAPRASDAVRRNATKLDEMRRSLKRLGVKEEDFWTSNMKDAPWCLKTRRISHGASTTRNSKSPPMTSWC